MKVDEATGDESVGSPFIRAPQGAAFDERFRPADRLLERRDYDRVLRQGRRRSGPELAVVIAPAGTRGRLKSRNESGPEAREPRRSRLGITVGRKCGSAVERNLFKRRVRDWFRHQRAATGRPIDLVVIARRPAIALSQAELGARLGALTGWVVATQVSGIEGKTVLS